MLSVRYDNLDGAPIAVTDAIGLKMDLGNGRYTGFDTDGSDYRLYVGWAWGKIGMGHNGATPHAAEYTIGANYGLVDKSRSICAPGSGVDLDRFSFASLNRNQSRKAFVFLFVGRVVGNKGIREFVGASEKVRARYPQVHCQILGWIDFGNPTAIAEQDLEEWVKRGTVEFLGSAEDVRSHIRNSDCVVLPSYREGTPRVLLEACAIGRPVIATDTPGCSRVVVDGITGLLCKARDSNDLAEKMVRMIEMSVEERVAMGLSGRQYVEEKFDEKIVIKQYIDAIDKCVYES